MKNTMNTPHGLSSITTLGELFAWRVERSPQAEAYRQFDAVAGQWRGYSWADMAGKVKQCRIAMQGLQLPHGSRVAILLPNCVDAVSIDQASLALGFVPVPMHAIDNPASIAYIIKDSDASMLVLSTCEQWNAIVAVGEAMPNLKLVILTEKPNPSSENIKEDVSIKVVRLSDWLSDESKERSDLENAERAETRATDLAAIVYTSGTTGKPKGVMLSHKNILSNIQTLLKSVGVGKDDIFLSFLPLSHTFERTVGYYLPIAAGACVAYARSTGLIAEDLKIIRPTALVSVPRIYERFYSKLQEVLAQSGALQQKLFKLAQKVGWRQFCRHQHLPVEDGLPGWLDAMLSPVLRALVARKVLAQFGGRMRFAVCGGAPMSQAVGECFLGLGLPLLQGYGMTETSPVVANNTVDDNWPATVGKALAGVQVRIGEGKELQVRGDSVMQGYWKRPEDTAKTMTEDGWLRTGDQASIEDGRIKIIGRIKEIIVTSTGEKISPADLELAITADPLFEQAFVIGENRPFIAVFVVLSKELWKTVANQLQVSDDAASLKLPVVRQALLEKIQQATKSFPSYAVPRAIRIDGEPWNIQNGLMTPTLKLKRNNLMKHFEADIEQVYAARAKT